MWLCRINLSFISHSNLRTHVIVFPATQLYFWVVPEKAHNPYDKHLRHFIFKVKIDKVVNFTCLNTVKPRKYTFKS